MLGQLPGGGGLVGPSNRGKSAVVRALRAVTRNDFHPSFIRKGAKECQLTLRIEDHPTGIKEVTLTRGGKTNRYDVLMEDGTTREYPKIGKNIPPELADLGFGEIETTRGDKFNLNIQGQLESLFLVTDSPVVVTSLLNTVFGIYRFEEAQVALNRDLIQEQKNLEALEQERIVLSSRLEEEQQHVQNLKSQRNILQSLKEKRDRQQIVLDKALTAVAGSRTLKGNTTLIAQMTVQKADQQLVRETINGIKATVFELAHLRGKIHSLGKDLSQLDIAQKQQRVLVKVRGSQRELVRKLEALQILAGYQRAQRSQTVLELKGVELSVTKARITSILALTQKLHLVQKKSRACTQSSHTLNLLSTLSANIRVAKEETRVLHKQLLHRHGKCPTCGVKT